MSLLSSCILSTGKTVESSGVNSLATVTQMWLTQRRPKPYSDRYPYLLIRQAEPQCCYWTGASNQSPECGDRKTCPVEISGRRILQSSPHTFYPVDVPLSLTMRC